MNQLTQSLIEICRQHPLDEKWLIAPSLRIGHQWIESVARLGQNVVNMKPKTFKGIAVKFALPEMSRQQLTLLSDTEGWILIDHVWNLIEKNQLSYLLSLNPSQNLFQNIFKSLNDIRLAGLQAEQIHPDSFEETEKGKELTTLLTAYLHELKASKLADYAEILRMAIARIQKDNKALSDTVLLLFPAEARFSGLEKQFKETFPKSKIRELSVDKPCNSPLNREDTKTDASLLCYLMNPHIAPQSYNDGTAKIFRAMGETNEVRKALRLSLAQRINLDDVELLHTDGETYIPLIYEIMQKFQKDTHEEDNFSIDNLPVTFAEGIPVRYSRPGRALQSWLDWIHHDYPQKTIFRMIHEGLINISEVNEGKFSFTRLSHLFRNIGIGSGRNRYSKKINEKLIAFRTEINTDKNYTDENSSITSESKEKLRLDLEGTQVLLSLINKILEISPASNVDHLKLLDSAIQFLENYARSVNELDNFAKMALIEEIEKIKQYCEHYKAPDSIHEWLQELPDIKNIQGSGPRPGCLHVSNIFSGGHSGRSHTIIIGLDDTRFPGAGLQDPILLDHERAKLSASLQTASGRRTESIKEFAFLLSQLRGTIVLGFSCRDILEDREMFPSSLVLNAYRILSGNMKGDLSNLLNWIESPASFAPDNSEECLDETEWLLQNTCGKKTIENVEEIIFNRFPHLERGYRARDIRLQSDFTIFDGLVNLSGTTKKSFSHDFHFVSVNKLETAGTCPLRYFFKFVLEIEPPQEIELDPERWLDPLQTGYLLHEVFYKFMNVLLRREIQPFFTRDEKQLNTILDEAVEWQRKECPPPNETAFHREYNRLKIIVKIFLQEQEYICKESHPVYLESAIGIKKYRSGSKLDTHEPIPVKLPDGKLIQVKGRIDRIDKLCDDKNSFIIWDYKTGSPKKYENSKDPFDQGRIVQHWLYNKIVETRLKEIESPQAKIIKFAYFFPGLHGRGKIIEKKPEELFNGGNVINCLCRIISEGCFIATDNKDDCDFCDYKEICDNLEEVTTNSKKKLDYVHNTCLQSFRELRKNE